MNRNLGVASIEVGDDLDRALGSVVRGVKLLMMFLWMYN